MVATRTKKDLMPMENYSFGAEPVIVNIDAIGDVQTSTTKVMGSTLDAVTRTIEQYGNIIARGPAIIIKDKAACGWFVFQGTFRRFHFLVSKMEVIQLHADILDRLHAEVCGLCCREDSNPSKFCEARFGVALFHLAHEKLSVNSAECRRIPVGP